MCVCVKVSRCWSYGPDPSAENHLSVAGVLFFLCLILPTFIVFISLSCFFHSVRFPTSSSCHSLSLLLISHPSLLVFKSISSSSLRKGPHFLSCHPSSLSYLFKSSYLSFFFIIPSHSFLISAHQTFSTSQPSCGPFFFRSRLLPAIYFIFFFNICYQLLCAFFPLLTLFHQSITFLYPLPFLDHPPRSHLHSDIKG